MPAIAPGTAVTLGGEDSDVDESLKATVLVVDDEIIIRMLIVDEFRSAAYRVMEAASADEGLELLHGGAVPDLLMTDIQMAGKHDVLALAHIAHQARPAMKIVIVSAALPDSDDEAADAMIAKPCEPAKLLAAVPHQAVARRA